MNYEYIKKAVLDSFKIQFGLNAKDRAKAVVAARREVLPTEIFIEKVVVDSNDRSQYIIFWTGASK